MEQYNLPPLNSIEAIDELDPETVLVYIAGYHLEELPEGPDQEAIVTDASVHLFSNTSPYH